MTENFDPQSNLVAAAMKVAAELSSEDPKVVERLIRRRHILAAVLRVPVRDLEAAQAATPAAA